MKMCKNFFIKYYFDVILKKYIFFYIVTINYSVNQYFDFYFCEVFQISMFYHIVMKNISKQNYI